MIGYNILQLDVMPAPAAQSPRYHCADTDIDVYYKFGSDHIRMANPSAAITGLIRADNQIDWGDYHAAGQTLGQIPPTHLRDASAYTLKFSGGMFEDVTCSARPATGSTAAP